MYAHFNHVTHILWKKWTHLCIKLHCMSKFVCLLHRVLPATAEGIGHLTALKGTPLAYQLTPRLPVEHTAVGPVQAGSPLPYHLCLTLTDLASTAVQTVFKMLSWKFVSKLHTNQISLMIGNNLIGILWQTNLKCFILPMRRSTWILCAAIKLVYATSEADICAAEEANGGMLSLSPRSSNSLFIVKPLSPIIASPAMRYPCAIFLDKHS